MRGNRNGFTLVELIVVTAVFVVVIMITSDAFRTILTQMAKITKSEESNIEGVVGLEMFRHDLQQSGYGLPYTFQAALPYLEVSGNPFSTNDGDGTASSAVPRALTASNNLAAVAGPDGDIAATIIAGTDYLALKGATLATNDVSQRWTYIINEGGAVTVKHDWENGNFQNNDRAIVLRRTFAGTTYTNQLIFDTTDAFWGEYNAADSTMKDKNGTTIFNPPNDREIYYAYGILNNADLRMPFNRTDYFVARPTAAGSLPAVCEPTLTGVLYKGTVSHADGKLTYIPLLDCVADMQVVLGWDLMDGMGNEGQDGTIETYSTTVGTSGIPEVSGTASQTTVIAALGDAERLRRALKIIKVYVLAQVGRRDAGYIFTGTDEAGQPQRIYVGDKESDGIVRRYDLTADQRSYHWKVYRIVVRPKNLQANQ